MHDSSVFDSNRSTLPALPSSKSIKARASRQPMHRLFCVMLRGKKQEIRRASLCFDHFAEAGLENFRLRVVVSQETNLKSKVFLPVSGFGPPHTVLCQSWRLKSTLFSVTSLSLRLEWLLPRPWLWNGRGSFMSVVVFSDCGFPHPLLACGASTIRYQQ